MEKRETIGNDERAKEKRPEVTPYKKRIPYPRRLRIQPEQLDKEYSKFLDMFKKLHINIPFAEALAQMPKYVKFLKELLSKKEKMKDVATVSLNEE